MNWLRKIRNGALFVDIILIIGAAVAIAGLAFFVRLHAGARPLKNKDKTQLSVYRQHAQTLEAAPESPPEIASGTNNDDGQNGQVQGAETTESSSGECPEACPIGKEPLQTHSCDDKKMRQLTESYDKQVADENSRYAAEAFAQNPVGGINSTLNDTASSLLQSHKLRLNSLKNSLNKNLQAMYCLQ